MNSIITLTTDFGTRDGFVGQMKGVILGIIPSTNLIDITHEVSPFSVLEAALVMKGVSTYFPRHTIHICVVDPKVGSSRRAIVISAGGQYYIGPDNGVFSWIPSSEIPPTIREITNPDFMLAHPHPTFHGRDILAPAAAHLSKGKSFASIGPVVRDPVVISKPEPRQTANGIRGEVMHVDQFGNLCTNIEAQSLQSVVRSVTFQNLIIEGIRTFFDQVPKGAPIAIINSFGFVEIAVNQGSAAETFGETIGQTVYVEWG